MHRAGRDDESHARGHSTRGLIFARPKGISNHFVGHWQKVNRRYSTPLSGGSMRPNFGAWQAQTRWWLHQAYRRCGEMLCLLIRTTAQLLIRMQDGPLWKRAHQAARCDIRALNRRARYAMAIGALSAVLWYAWGFGLKLHSFFHETEIEQTDRAALDAMVKGIVEIGFSGKSDADGASDDANLK
jgi:hypothetical protein